MKNSFPIEWGRQRRDAGHYLIATSNLCEHHTFLENVLLRHRDDGPDLVDIEALETWPWSSGERTLVNLFLTFAGFNRSVTVNDIFCLDPKNRNAAGNALSMACAKENHWDPRSQSVLEAF